MTDNDSSNGGTTLTYLEFYSGIGGWTLALEKACRDIAANTNTNTNTNASTCVTEGGDSAVSPRICSVQRLASYDHSDLCNAVFAHNFISDSGDGGDNGDNGDKKKPQAAAAAAEKRQQKKQKRNNASAALRPPPPPASFPTYPIEKLTATDLASLNADIWAMSPPCQPHTRQHGHHSAEEELNDPRSKSFLHLIELMYELGSSTTANTNTTNEGGSDDGNGNLPSIILLENVVGFEASASCQKYKQALVDNGYVYAELHLNPTQVGIPNDRPRYYCCAVKDVKRCSIEGGRAEADVLGNLVDMLQNTSSGDSNPQSSRVHTAIPSLGVVEVGSLDISSSLPNIESYLDRDLPPLAPDASSTNATKLEKVQISKKTIEKSAAWCFDIITRDDARSACFTSSYGKYVKGTGSVLYRGRGDITMMKDAAGKVESKDDGQATDVFRLVNPKERSYDATWWERLVSGDGGSPPLRYLSGEEVARLMGFPLKGVTSESSTQSDSVFSFPEWCTEKQKWRLLGNSINVAVSARIAELGMRMLLSKK